MEQQWIRYLMVGGSIAACYTASVWVGHELLRLPRDPLVVSLLIFFTLGHFALNRKHTFKSQNGQVLGQFMRFLGVVAFNALASLAVIRGLVDGFGAHLLVGTSVAILVTSATGYFLNKWLVFKA